MAIKRRAVTFVGRRPHRVDVDRRRVDREEHVRRRAELLDDSRLDLDRRRAIAGGWRMLKVLRPDAEDDLPRGDAGRSPVAGKRHAEAGELDRILGELGFDEVHRGEPMNAATKRFVGFR